MSERLEFTVKCPWPWCPGKMTVSNTGDLRFLIESLTTFYNAHQNCKPQFTYTATVTPDAALDGARD